MFVSAIQIYLHLLISPPSRNSPYYQFVTNGTSLPFWHSLREWISTLSLETNCNTNRKSDVICLLSLNIIILNSIESLINRQKMNLSFINLGKRSVCNQLNTKPKLKFTVFSQHDNSSKHDNSSVLQNKWPSTYRRVSSNEPLG